MGPAQLRLDKPCIQFMCTVLYRNLRVPHRRTRNRFNPFRSKLQKQQRPSHPRIICPKVQPSHLQVPIIKLPTPPQPQNLYRHIRGQMVLIQTQQGITHLILLHKFDLSHSLIDCGRYICLDPETPFAGKVGTARSLKRGAWWLRCELSVTHYITAVLKPLR